MTKAKFPLAERWPDQCYSRLLIDNHITDIKTEYMSRFDSDEYVRMVKLAGVDSAMVYACDHNGNSYYPTRTGHLHRGIGDRDIFNECVTKLRRAHIVPIGYYTVIYHNHLAQTHPECNMRDYQGATHYQRCRYCCPNHPLSREFFTEQLREIAVYPIQGIFIDMTFWPMICCCESCRSRFGRAIPEVIDWDNPDWVRFQRFREQSLGDFAKTLTAAVKASRPDLTVTHQFSPMLHGWTLGQSALIAAASDYASGDFYGGKVQQRFGTKAFYAYSRSKPYEFMTSRCVSLRDHTSTKSDEELFLHALTTLANGGAYLFIDAINPDGTLDSSFYQRLHRIVKKLEPFKQLIATHRAEPMAEVGLYFSMSSCGGTTDRKTALRDVVGGLGNMEIRHNAVLDEIIGTSVVLGQLHIPYRVLTDADAQTDGLKTIIVNNAAYLNEDEANMFRRFVHSGGTLIATGKTSFYDREGASSGNFALADLFGVDFSGQVSEKVSYLTMPGGEQVSSTEAAPLVLPRQDSVVHGRVTLTDFPYNHREHYAAIHSNPPGALTDYTGMSEHRYGQGVCVYLYSNVLAIRQHAQQSFCRKWLSRYLPELVCSSRNLPMSTEINLLRSRFDDSLLISIVNYQDELPNIPLIDVSVSCRLPASFVLDKVTSTRNDGNVKCEFRHGILKINLARLEEGEFLLLTRRKK